MKHVFDTLDGADDFPDFTVSTTAMRWRPTECRPESPDVAVVDLDVAESRKLLAGLESVGMRANNARSPRCGRSPNGGS